LTSVPRRNRDVEAGRVNVPGIRDAMRISSFCVRLEGIKAVLGRNAKPFVRSERARTRALARKWHDERDPRSPSAILDRAKEDREECRQAAKPPKTQESGGLSILLAPSPPSRLGGLSLWCSRIVAEAARFADRWALCGRRCRGRGSPCHHREHRDAHRFRAEERRAPRSPPSGARRPGEYLHAPGDADRARAYTETDCELTSEFYNCGSGTSYQTCSRMVPRPGCPSRHTLRSASPASPASPAKRRFDLICG
jgi:hypothetical protein